MSPARETSAEPPLAADPRAWRARLNLALLTTLAAVLLLPPPFNFGLIAAVLGAGTIARARSRGAARGGGREVAAVPEDPTVVSLGVGSNGAPVTLSERELGAHGLILGASGSGKTTTLLKILTAQIARGAPVVALDMKGSPAFARELAAAAAAAGRPFRVWSDDGPEQWNPLAHGNATELKDKLIATERFTEPHYQRAAERYVQMALGVLAQARPGRSPTLPEVVAAMEPAHLRRRLRELEPDRAAVVEGYLAGLTRDQLSAIRGLGTRLAVISESHTGAFLGDDGAAAAAIDLHAALEGREVVLFSLNSGRYGKLAGQLGTLAVQDLIAATGRRLEGASRVTATVAIDEFSALGADNVLQLLARGREAGVSVLLSTQELADLDRAARGLRDQVLGNTDLKLAHRQDVPASAQTVAELGGTYKAWDRTYRTGGGLIGEAMIGGGSGPGSRRIVDRYIVEPNTIKTLRTGEAVRIGKTPEPLTHIVRVTPTRSPPRGASDLRRPGEPSRPERGGAER